MPRQAGPFAVLWHMLFATVVAIYPYIFLVYAFFPAVFLRFNLYFVVVTVVIGAFFLRRVFERMPATHMYLILCAFLLYGAILATHFTVHDEPLDSVMSFRIGIMPIIFIVVSMVAKKERSRKVLSSIVVINAFIQAAIGAIHYHFFPNVVTGSGYLPEGSLIEVWPEGEGGFRENGSLFSASLYAHMILLGMMLLALRNPENIGSARRLVESIVVLIMFYGILLSNSRYPSVIALILFVFYVVQWMRVSSARWLSGVLFVTAVFALVIVPHYESIINRFFLEGMDVRNVKNTLAFDALFSNVTNFLIGAETSMYASLVSVDGIGISDNSFFAIGLSLGFVYTAILLAIILFLVSQTLTLNKITIFMLGYLSINLFLTNAIYWDIYILYFFITLYAINPDYPSKKPQFQPQSSLKMDNGISTRLGS